MSSRPRTSLLLRSILAICLSPCAGALLGAQEGADGSAYQTPDARRARIVQGRVLKLTLEDVVRIALQQNLDLEAEKIATEIARFDLSGSWGAFDPLLTVTGTAIESENQGQSQLSGGNVIENDSLGLNSGISLPLITGGTASITFDRSNDKSNNTFSTFDVSTTDVFTLSFTQPLLRGAWERYATTSQRTDEISLQRQIAREDEVRANLVRDVYHAYWDLVSAIEELHVRELAVERGNKQLDQDRRRLELGAGTEVDVLQSETNVAQQEESLLNARFGLRNAEDTLRRRVFQNGSKLLEGEEDWREKFLDGWDWAIEPLTALPAAEELELDWRYSFDRALAQRPELVQMRLDIDTAEVAHDQSWSTYLPQLDFNITRSAAGFSNKPSDAFETASGFDFPTTSASLDFSLPIRNRSAKYALRSAESGIRQAQLNYDRKELDILAEVRAAVRDVLFSIEAVQAAEKSAALAKRQEEAELLRLEIGLSTTFQLLEFQETLAEANSTLVAAQASYAKSLVSLDHAEGVLGTEAGNGN